MNGAEAKEDGQEVQCAWQEQVKSLKKHTSHGLASTPAISLHPKSLKAADV